MRCKCNYPLKTNKDNTRLMVGISLQRTGNCSITGNDSWTDTSPR